MVRAKAGPGRARALRGAVRRGKIQNGQLVGEDSSDEYDDGEESIRNKHEMLELLRSGNPVQVVNGKMGVKSDRDACVSSERDAKALLSEIPSTVRSQHLAEQQRSSVDRRTNTPPTKSSQETSQLSELPRSLPVPARSASSASGARAIKTTEVCLFSY